MTRVRVSTTVDAELLADVRARREGVRDADLIDEALAALRAKLRRTEIDSTYDEYDVHPLDEPDEWGDLETFLEGAAKQ